MKGPSILLVHLPTAVARPLGPGGAKTLAAESLLIKQHLLILTRSRRRAPNLRPLDRLLLGFLSMFIRPGRFPKLPVGLHAGTLRKFHPYLVRRTYQALFLSRTTSRPGPKGPSDALIHAIVALKRRNPRCGCSRIALIIGRTFGVEIDKDVLGRVLAKNDRPELGAGGSSRLTFIGHMKDSLWSVDLFLCESILLRTHWVLVVMDQFTRRIIGFGIEEGAVDGIALCRMCNHATARQGIPRYLSTDHDPRFEFRRWKANLRVFEVDELKTIPFAPTTHPSVERRIGTIRRAFLDHVLFWNSGDLERKLSTFLDDYNFERVHSGINGATPFGIGGESRAEPADPYSFRWNTHCRGLFQLPKAA